MKLSESVALLRTFGGVDLTQTLAKIEGSLAGATTETCGVALSACGAKVDVLNAAGLVKRLASQINVIVHALGILLCLPHILESNEVIEYVSLGAGNTGKEFDLETNFRVAEFKFIDWKGGPEAIRQNNLFKDFYLLTEYPGDKRKFLYVLGTTIPLKFFNSNRALSSILSHQVKLREEFLKKFGKQYQTVRDYYLPRKEFVSIQDVSVFIPELAGTAPDAESFLE